MSPLAPDSAALAVLALGASVRFVDTDGRGALGMPALSEALGEAERSGRTPKALILTHLVGTPANLAGISHLANLNGFFVIEDASAGAGARYGETRVGDCRYSDLVVSAIGMDGALITTNRDDWAAAIARLAGDGREHGRLVAVAWNVALGEEASTQALERLGEWPQELERRQAWAEALAAALGPLGVGLPDWDEDHVSALAFYPVRLGGGRDEALDALGDLAEAPRTPLSLEPLFGAAPDFPEAERYAAETIWLRPLADPATVTERLRSLR